MLQQVITMLYGTDASEMQGEGKAIPVQTLGVPGG